MKLLTVSRLLSLFTLLTRLLKRVEDRSWNEAADMSVRISDMEQARTELLKEAERAKKAREKINEFLV